MIALDALLLLLLPLAAYLLWRRFGPANGEPSSAALLGLALAVAVMIGTGLWYGLSHSIAPGTAYVPARLGGDGEVTPGHGEPRR